MTSPTGNNNNGTWTVTGVPAGLYMVVVTSNTPGTMYNPIFVAANWIGGSESSIAGSSWVVDSAASYSDKAVAKKSTIPLEKTATGHTPAGTNDDTDPYRTDVGEIIDFTVTSKIPKFGSNYTKPVFKLEDKLTGLALTGAPVVKAGETTLTATSAYTDSLDSGAYVLTNGAEGNDTYTIQFTKAYLDSVANAGQDITITYSAKVTDKAEKIINQDKNTVTLSFSTNPTDESGKGKLRDETNHYTFSIDAGLLGDSDQESSTEAIKVGLDKDGNPIEESKTYWHQGTHPALDGAVFGLYKNENDAKSKNTNYYKNDVFNGTVTSDETGRLTIKGLDVGEYYLMELEAPKGYIAHQDPIKVVIAAEINTNVSVTEDADGTEVTFITNELTSYSVTIGGTETTYNVPHSLADITKSQVKRTSTSDEEIVNTKGVELPATGGMGTTLFYAIGAILVIGAGILLVSKRRMSAN